MSIFKPEKESTERSEDYISGDPESGRSCGYCLFDSVYQLPVKAQLYHHFRTIQLPVWATTALGDKVVQVYSLTKDGYFQDLVCKLKSAFGLEGSGFVIEFFEPDFNTKRMLLTCDQDLEEALSVLARSESGQLNIVLTPASPNNNISFIDKSPIQKSLMHVKRKLEGCFSYYEYYYYLCGAGLEEILNECSDDLLNKEGTENLLILADEIVESLSCLLNEQTLALGWAVLRTFKAHVTCRIVSILNNQMKKEQQNMENEFDIEIEMEPLNKKNEATLDSEEDLLIVPCLSFALESSNFPKDEENTPNDQNSASETFSEYSYEDGIQFVQASKIIDLEEDLYSEEDYSFYSEKAKFIDDQKEEMEMWLCEDHCNLMYKALLDCDAEYLINLDPECVSLLSSDQPEEIETKQDEPLAEDIDKREEQFRMLLYLSSEDSSLEWGISPTSTVLSSIYPKIVSDQKDQELVDLLDRAENGCSSYNEDRRTLQEILEDFKNISEPKDIQETMNDFADSPKNERIRCSPVLTPFPPFSFDPPESSIDYETAKKSEFSSFNEPETKLTLQNDQQRIHEHRDYVDCSQFSSTGILEMIDFIEKKCISLQDEIRSMMFSCASPKPTNDNYGLEKKMVGEELQVIEECFTPDISLAQDEVEKTNQKENEITQFSDNKDTVLEHSWDVHNDEERTVEIKTIPTHSVEENPEIDQLVPTLRLPKRVPSTGIVVYRDLDFKTFKPILPSTTDIVRLSPLQDELEEELQFADDFVVVDSVPDDFEEIC